MEPTQEKWIIKLAAATKVRISFEGKESAKKAALQEAFALVDTAKDDIKAGMTFSVTQDGQTVYSMTEDSEQIDEIETAEAGQGSGLSAAEMKRAGAAQQKLVEMQKSLEEKLRKAGLNEKEIQETITEEFYFPLVREKLMPDNLVPDKYSKTQEMLDATNQLYKEAIKDLDPHEGEDDAFAKAKKGIGFAAEVGKGITSIIGDNADLAEHAKLAGDIISLTEVVLTTAVTAGEAISKDQLRGSIEDIVGNVGSILTKAVSFYDPSIANVVGTIYTASTKTALVAKYLSDSPPQIEAALNSFSEGFVAAFTAGAMKMDNQKQKDDLLAAATAVGSAIKAAKNIKTIKDAIDKRDFAGLVTAVSQMGKEAVAIGLNTKAAVEGAGKTDDEKKALDKEAKDMLEKIDAAITAGELAISTGAIVYSAAMQGEISGASETVVANIGKALEGLLKSFAPPAVASTVSSAFKATTSAGLVANFLVKGDPAKAIAALGDGFASTMDLINPDADNKTFTTVGKSMAAAFKAGVKAAEIKKALDDGDVDSVIDLLSQAGKDVSSSVLDIKSTSNDDETTKSEKDIGDTVGEGIDKATDIAKDVAKLKEMMADPAAKKKMEDKLAEKQTQDAKDEIEREQKEFDRMLTLVDEGGEAGADTRSVEILIQQMQKDKLIMDLVLKIGGGGLDMAAKFVPGLAVAGAAVKMAASLTAAANRAMALNKWLDNQKDGKAASSVYSTSIGNFVTNQQEQFAYYTIKSALQLAQLIGATLSVSGLGATVGEPLQKAAALAETVVDKAKEFYDEAQLDKAWNTTKLALNNRNNRKLGLIARKQNPTLAKYSLAWGAVEKKDAIAKSAMASCGLNATTLAQKDANVNNVVKYLETMFADDRQVRRGLPQPGGWQPSEVTLTARCFTAGKLGAEKKANLAKQDTGALEGCFIAVAELEVTVSKGKKEKTLKEEQLNDYDAELKRLGAGLKGYKPLVDKTGGEHSDMKDFIDQLAGLAEVESKLLDGARKELASTAPPKTGAI